MCLRVSFYNSGKVIYRLNFFFTAEFFIFYTFLTTFITNQTTENMRLTGTCWMSRCYKRVHEFGKRCRRVRRKKGKHYKDCKVCCPSGAQAPVGHARTETWKANKGNRRWSVCPSAQKRTVCSGKMSLNTKLTAAIRADLRQPLPSTLLNPSLPTDVSWREHDFLLLAQNWGFSFRHCQQINTKYEDWRSDGALKGAINKWGTRAAQVDLFSCPAHTRVRLEGCRGYYFPVKHYNFLAFKGETFAGSAPLVSFSHALLWWCHPETPFCLSYSLFPLSAGL